MARSGPRHSQSSKSGHTGGVWCMRGALLTFFLTMHELRDGAVAKRRSKKLMLTGCPFELMNRAMMAQ